MLLSCSGNKTNFENNEEIKQEPPKRYGWYDEPLYGDIESITTNEYSLTDKFGEIIKSDIEKQIIHKFNENGDVYETSEYYLDKSMHNLYGNKCIYNYEFNDYKFEIEEYDSHNNLKYKTICKCNKDGYINEEAKYNNRNILESLSKYDDKGNFIECTAYKTNGSMSFKFIDKYDEEGNMVEQLWFNDNGKINYKAICKYDSNKNMIEQEVYNVNNSDYSLKRKEIHKYNFLGKREEQLFYDSNGSFEYKYTFKYDKKGNLIERIRYDNEIMIPKELTEYIITYR